MGMKTLHIYIILIVLPALCFSCCNNEETDTTNECEIDISTIDFSFGIDYNNPELYLIPGEESDLNAIYLEEIRDEIGTPDYTIAGALLVCHWVNQNFTFENAGGAMMGINTVDELYEIKTVYGCHSSALVISSILREFGFPAVMIETASVQWGYAYNAGNVQYFAGHVMSEIFAESKWILLDNNCTYVEEYDAMNPFINSNNPQDDYFVYAKGVDIWDYNGHDNNFTHDKMIWFSDNTYCFEEMFNTVNYNWSN